MTGIRLCLNNGIFQHIYHDTARYARVYQTWTGFLAPHTIMPEGQLEKLVAVSTSIDDAIKYYIF